MCGSCGRIWTSLHVLWALVYVCAGAVQIVTGIFFLISIPALKLCSNVWAGSWNVVAGIGGGMLACFGETTPRRQEWLLYVTMSILVINTINAVLTEWSFYNNDLGDHAAGTGNLQHLVFYARITASISAAAVLIVAFLDSQLTFCSIDGTKSVQRSRSRKMRGSHEQVSDIEYIIPRPKSSSQSRPTNTSAYSQSWVFEAENSNSNNAVSPYLKLPQDTDSIIGNGKDTSSESAKIISEETVIIANPVVHIEEASDESTSNSDRKLCYMKSFSRSTSPAVLSAASSQISLDNNSNPPIYECLEKLTEPSVYRSRLNTALSIREEDAPVPYVATSPKKPEVTSPRGSDQVQYASLMVELEQALSKKDKTHNILSPDTQTNSNSSRQDESSSKSESHHTDLKSSDADFSKELEAALQLIQDLESPNTAETPSETCGQRPLAVWRHSDASGSEKTLSAVGSLAELTSPMTECLPELRVPLHGKGTKLLLQCTDSQSTSGYSSPTRKWTPNWSTNSSIDGSTADLQGKNFTIKTTTNSTAVISLFTPNQYNPKKSVTVVKLNQEDLKNNNNVTAVDDGDKKSLVRRSSSGGSTTTWNVKSLLRKKKPVPKLSAELESAIIKSESLAHLTELELLARHERNREIQRRIEQRVQQQLGQMTESNC